MIHVMVKIWFAPILLFSMLFAQAALAESPAAKTDSDVSKNKPKRVVMVRVNDEEITVEDFVNFLQKNPTHIQAYTSNDGKANAIRSMVANALLRQRMTGDGLLSDSEKVTEEKLKQSYSKFSEKHFPLPPAPAEKAVRRYYLQHQNDFSIPELARVSQVQFRVPEKATPEQKSAARKKAEVALERLKAGEPFAKVAEELTENPAAKTRGGDLGFFPRQEISWLRDALKDLKPGQYSRVIESPAGYEILLFTDVRPRLNSTYEDVRDKVAQRMQLEAQSKARKAYLDRLSKEAKIQIVQEELKPLFPKGIFP